MLTNCKVDDIVLSSVDSNESLYTLILHTFMSKMNYLGTAALASVLSLAPAHAEAAKRKDTVKDENAEKIGSFQLKIGAMAGFVIDPVEVAIGGHMHTTNPNENAALDAHVALHLNDDFKLGVKFQNDTHKTGPDEASLGGFINTKFGHRDLLGFDAGVQFKLQRHAGDVSQIAGFDTRFTGEFYNGMYIGAGAEGEFHPERKNTCVLGEIGYRGMDVGGQHGLEIGMNAGPCSVDTGNINASEVGFHLSLIPNFGK